jgi:2-dehydropantoate 2-reductase
LTAATEEERVMRFLIFGTGGVGGFFGAKLAHAGNDVWLVARGEHLRAMKSGGLRVRSTEGEFVIPPGKMTDVPQGSGPVDVVLFCVKSYDTETAAQQLVPVLDKNSVVLSLQNGVDNEEKISRIIPHARVYGGVAYVSARITAPGEITETGGFHRIVFGPMDGAIDERSREIHRLLVDAGIKCDLREKVLNDLWNKFVFITSMGSFTAVSRLTQGEIIAQPETISAVFRAMHEVEALAWKQGVDIEPLNEAKMLENLKRFDPDTRSSMYYDLVAQKPLEVEALNGTVVRLGKEVGVPTPVHNVMYAALLPYHLKHLRLRQIPS